MFDGSENFTVGITPPDALSMGSIQPFDEERCDIVAEHASTVVSFHFGLPGTHLVDRLKSAGSLIMSSATTIKEARWLEDNGCDVIIAQGLEAGGHRGMFLSTDIGGQMGTFSLVPQIADAVDCPVVAAGGISDGRGIVAALALGASAVQIGTAYLFTDEATISDVYRRSLDQVASVDTVVTNVFSGRPTRTLSNKVVAELGPIAESAPAFPKGFLAIGPLWMYAEAQGSRDFSAHYCGQSASLGYKATAYQLTTDLADDAARRMNALWK